MIDPSAVIVVANGAETICYVCRFCFKANQQAVLALMTDRLNGRVMVVEAACLAHLPDLRSLFELAAVEAGRTGPK